MVVENCRSFRDEVHFCEFLSVRDYGFSGFVDSAVHAHNELMLETKVCVQEEAVEVILKSLEKGF